MLGQLSELSKFAKVDKPLNKPKSKAEKDFIKKKGVKVVDGAGRAEDEDDDGEGAQGLFEN